MGTAIATEVAPKRTSKSLYGIDTSPFGTFVFEEIGVVTGCVVTLPPPQPYPYTPTPIPLYPYTPIPLPLPLPPTPTPTVPLQVRGHHGAVCAPRRCCW